MKISELAKLIEADIITEGLGENDVTCGLSCDLLSWVMSKGKPGCAWVTVQTHMNVIAVASLHDMACVIWPEGIQPETESAEKAAAEGIAVLTTKLTAYKVCALMGGANIPSA